MKAIEFEAQNVVFAKDQPEYLPLPALVQPENGIVTFCMELDDEEVEKIVADKSVTIEVLTFNRPAQPIGVNVTEPEFPVPFQRKWEVNPHWVEDGKKAQFTIELLPLQIQNLKSKKQLWITTTTYGAPLQPISMNII